MPQYFVGTDTNRIGNVHVDDNTAQLRKITFYPAAPNPDNLSAGTHAVPTEWLVPHPTQPAVLVFTSYWNKHPANMACFKTSEDGSLEKVFDLSTGGRQACHAMFHPKRDGDTLALAVAHHNDAMVTFFQFPSESIPDTLENQPALIVELPELVPGTRKTLGTGTMGLSIPSCHQVYYASSGRFLLCVDPNQSAIITYEVDDTGLPTKPEATSTFKCHTDTPASSYVFRAMGKVMGYGCRPRRVAISPNGKYVFISYETRNVVQVYPIDEDGKIDPEDKGCMQEISTLEESMTKKRIIGLAGQMSAELLVFDDSLYVSNRGIGFLGPTEDSVKVFDIKEDGGRLVVRQTIHFSGPVRHFLIQNVAIEDQNSAGDDNIVDGDAKDLLLVAGTSRPGRSLQLQTFRRHFGDRANEFELVGEAEVGASVLCIVEGRA